MIWIPGCKLDRPAGGAGRSKAGQHRIQPLHVRLPGCSGDSLTVIQIILSIIYLAFQAYPRIPEECANRSLRSRLRRKGGLPERPSPDE